MPLYVSRPQKLPQLPKLPSINNPSMENNSTSTTMKSKKSEKLNMRKCMIRLISKTTKNKTPTFQNWWVNQKSLPSWTNWSNSYNQEWCSRTDNNNNKTEDKDHQEWIKCSKTNHKDKTVLLCHTECNKCTVAPHNNNNNKWEWCQVDLQWWIHKCKCKCKCHLQWTHKWCWDPLNNICKSHCKFYQLFTLTTQIIRLK